MQLYTGEVNAGLSFGGCARWLGKDFPHDTKLIFMMRDPADRCYSAYKYFLDLGFLPMSVVADDKKEAMLQILTPMSALCCASPGAGRKS